MVKNKKVLLLSVASLLLILLSSCQSKTEEEVLEAVKEKSKEVFHSKSKIETNENVEDLSLYLPKNIKVEEIEENNIVLTDGKQTYIIFYNDLESPMSTLNYDMAQQLDNNELLLKSFQDKEKFGYVQVSSVDEDLYELQIGVGGVKITTYATKNKLTSHSEELMKIVRSIIETNVDD